MIGQLSEELLNAVLETIPVEFSVLDADDKVAAWNRHETRIFKRPKGVVGRNVRDCHPKKSLDKVERILKEMKEGKRDKARFWIDLPTDDKKRKVLIEYTVRLDRHNRSYCTKAVTSSHYNQDLILQVVLLKLFIQDFLYFE